MAIHVSDQDAARDFLSLLAQVRAGQEVIIENESLPVAVLHRPAEMVRPRLLSDSLVLAKKHTEERGGCEAVMDEDFARDMEDIIRLRDTRPRREPLEWD